MKPIALIVALAAVAGLSGCVRPNIHHQALTPISRLDCPQSQGRFERAGVAPDGRSCDYSAPDGAKLQLKLVSFSGDADTALQPVEAQMKTMLPAPPPAPPKPPTAPAASAHDTVNIDLPGISIHADDRNAKVDVAGVHVNADDDHNTVHVTGHSPMSGRGQFTVDANDAGAVVRSRGFGPNFEQSLILVSTTPGPEGWRTVGYEALGPKAGPLVIVNFQSREDEHDALFGEVRALARRAARG